MGHTVGVSAPVAEPMREDEEEEEEGTEEGTDEGRRKGSSTTNILVPGQVCALQWAMPVVGGFWAIILTRPVWARRWARCGFIKVGGCRRGLCLNRCYGAGPTCSSLDHRARACYLPCSLPYNELHHAVGMRSLLVPPSAF